MWATTLATCYLLLQYFPYTDSCLRDTVLDDDGVAELCVDGCYASLESARKSIQGACTKTDAIVFEDVAYPGIKFPCQPPTSKFNRT